MVFLVTATEEECDITVGDRPCDPLQYDGQCYNDKQECDSQKDCENGFDEDKLRCTQLYWPKVFTLDELHDFEHHFQEEGGSFTPGCCLQIKCRVDLPCTCFGNSLRWYKQPPATFVPPSCIRSMIFAGVGLEKIIAAQMTLPKPRFLKSLTLSKNFISDIESLTFKDSHIDLLDLSYNNIVKIPNDLRNSSIHFVKFSHNHIGSIQKNNFANVKTLQFMLLDHNIISIIEFGAPHLVYLNLNHNNINCITNTAFAGSPKIKHLILRKNNLAYIHDDALEPLKSLKVLDVSMNKLAYLPTTWSSQMNNLTVLDLRGNFLLRLQRDNLPIHLESVNLGFMDFYEISISTFEDLHNLQTLFVTHLYYCLFAPRAHRCVGEDRYEIFTRLDMLGDAHIRNWTKVNSGLILLLNALVIFLYSNKNTRTGSNAYTIGLVIADFVMGLYLGTIAILDYIWGGKFRYKAIPWMKSVWCALVGIMAGTAFRASHIIVMLICIDRCVKLVLAYRHNIDSQDGEMAYMSTIVTVVVFAVSLGLTLVPLAISRWTPYYGSTPCCVPLHIYTPNADAALYSRVMFGLDTLLVVVTVLASVVILVRTLFREPVRGGSSKPVNRRKKAVWQSTVLIVGINIVWWLPMIVLRCMAFTNVHMHYYSDGFTAILLMPIRALLNPLVAIFTKVVVWAPEYTSRRRTTKTRSTTDFSREEMDWFCQENLEAEIDIPNIKASADNTSDDTDSILHLAEFETAV